VVGSAHGRARAYDTSGLLECLNPKNLASGLTPTILRPLGGFGYSHLQQHLGKVCYANSILYSDARSSDRFAHRGLKYRTLSQRDKTHHLPLRATVPGYEHTQTKLLARTVARQFRFTEVNGDMGDINKSGGEGGIEASVVEREVSGW
jgi:hypothetical protein